MWSPSNGFALLGVFAAASTIVNGFVVPNSPSIVSLGVKTSNANPGFISQWPSTHSSRYPTSCHSTVELVEPAINKADNILMKRIVRIANHLPTLATIYYFGLISSAMMGMNSAASMGPATLSSVLTKRVGSTTQAAFSNLFPTLLTPANFVFLIWPLISVVQLGTIGISALWGSNALLEQGELTCLSLANLAATGWLLVASRATGPAAPLLSFLALPFVAIFSGYPLRQRANAAQATKVTGKNFIFQLYSSFTSFATLLALAVELQHGGRIGFLAGRGEVVALLVLGAVLDVGYRTGNGIVKRAVSLFFAGGVLFKRIADLVSGAASFSVFNTLSLFLTSAVTLILAINLREGH